MIKSLKVIKKGTEIKKRIHLVLWIKMFLYNNLIIRLMNINAYEFELNKYYYLYYQLFI